MHALMVRDHFLHVDILNTFLITTDSLITLRDQRTERDQWSIPSQLQLMYC